MFYYFTTTSEDNVIILFFLFGRFDWASYRSHVLSWWYW